MDNKQKAQLQRMIEEYGVQDTTQDIRDAKQSSILLKELHEFERFRRTSRLSKYMFAEKARTILSYWHTNYKSIFDKIVMNEINMDILNTFVLTLKQVEDGNLNQHEASFKIGSILKQMYVDSKIDESRAKSSVATSGSQGTGNGITWKQYKESMELHNVD
jgi:hypothetical protein